MDMNVDMALSTNADDIGSASCSCPRSWFMCWMDHLSFYPYYQDNATNSKEVVPFCEG